MPEQNELRQDDATEQPSSGLLLSVESLGQEGSPVSYRLADDSDPSDSSDTSDSDGTDADSSDASDADGSDSDSGSDADGTDASDADGTDTGLDADGAEPLGIGGHDTTDGSHDNDGTDSR